MLKKFCNKCNTLINQGEKYCEKHKGHETTDKRERNRHYDKYRRNKEAAVFYNSKEWKAVRKLALRRDKGLCIECLKNGRIKPYDVVDHIKPLEHFPALGLVLANLQCLCHQCHRIKTAEDVKRYG